MFKPSGTFDGNPQQWNRFSIKFTTDAKADGGYFLFLSDKEDTSAPALHQSTLEKIEQGEELDQQEFKQNEIFKQGKNKRQAIAARIISSLKTSLHTTLANIFISIEMEDEKDDIIKFKKMWSHLKSISTTDTRTNDSIFEKIQTDERSLKPAETDPEAIAILRQLQHHAADRLLLGDEYRYSADEIRRHLVRLFAKEQFQAFVRETINGRNTDFATIIRRFESDASKFRGYLPHSQAVSFASATTAWSPTSNGTDSATVSAVGTDRNDRLDKVEKTLTEIVQQISERRERSRDRTTYPSDRGSDRTQQYSERNRYTERERDDRGNGREWNFNRDSGRDRRSNSRERSRSRDYHRPPSSRPRDNQYQ